MPRVALSHDEIASMRESIADAAMELVRDHGPEAVSFRRIAAKLGCSHTTPYRYFASKDEIIVALRARAFRAFGAKLTRAIRDVEAPAAERLRSLVAAYVGAAMADPDAYRLMLDLNQGNANGEPELLAAKEGALGTCREVVAAAVAAGELPRGTDPNLVAHVFWSGAHGLVSLALAQQLVLGCSLDQLVDVMAETLVQGVLASPAQPTRGR